MCVPSPQHRHIIINSQDTRNLMIDNACPIAQLMHTHLGLAAYLRRSSNRNMACHHAPVLEILRVLENGPPTKDEQGSTAGMGSSMRSPQMRDPAKTLRAEKGPRGCGGNLVDGTPENEADPRITQPRKGAGQPGKYLGTCTGPLLLPPHF